MTNREKMLAGLAYFADDAELVAMRRAAFDRLFPFNANGDVSAIAGLFGAAGDGLVIVPRFACDFGFNIRFGRKCFVNYDCVFLDCAPIAIGDFLQMGPAVQLYTALHPLDPEERRSGLESARPITIGNDVWIGGGAIVLPGISIGDGAVVGAGSVVTRDVAARTLVAGNPARFLRAV